MSDIRLTCDETPLAWPTMVTVDDLTKCGSCGFRLLTSQPGSLQVLTRRQGTAGVGDGVTIEEDPALGVDYRGQRYTYDESVMHIPGLHVFPGQKEVYPAEYHLHFKTFSAPQRAITIVIPASHRVSGPGEAYFAAMAAKPDPSVKRPLADTLVTPGTKVIQYRGPDIRGRTKDKSQTSACSAEEERQFLLVLTVAQIRATDLERIPREGSLSTDPRDLPAPGVKSKTTLPRDRILRCAVLAEPGVLGPTAAVTGVQKVEGPATNELQCNPVKVVDGRDTVIIGKKQVSLSSFLGKPDTLSANNRDVTAEATDIQSAVQTGLEMFMAVIGVLLGLYVADLLCQGFWNMCFKESNRLTAWEPLKWQYVGGMVISAAGLSYGSSSGGISRLYDNLTS